jgi:AcrR family transcriptional regulator
MRAKSPVRGPRGKNARKRPPGRPRSEQARLAILRGTLQLLGENGFPDLTMEAVAAHAGVAKATVYRWWPNKAALIADAFASSATRKLHFPDTGSLVTDMSRQMRQLIKVFRSRRGRIVSAILGAGQSDRALVAARKLTQPSTAPSCAANSAPMSTSTFSSIPSTAPSICAS